MNDDEKQGAEPDPWAGLDADADGDAGGHSAGDDAAFIFDMLGDDSDDGVKPAPDEPVPDDGVADDAGDDAGIESPAVPLAVFPPPDSDFASSDDDAGRTVPEPAAVSDADGESSFPMDEIGGFAGFDTGDGDADPFDGAAIASELAGGSPGEDASDFNGESGLPPTDDVSFNADALPAGDASPFADMGQADPFGMQAESSIEDSAAVPVATTAAAVAASLPSARKKKGGIGQILGVVLGGVMALPVTYAILIWGFQKDPFKLARKLPDQVAFLVPQSLRQGGAGPGGRPGSAGPRSTARTLDEIDRPADESPADAAPPATMAVDGAAADPDAADESSADGTATSPGEGKMVADAAALPDAEDAASAAVALFKGRDVPPELAEEFRAAVAKLATTEEIQAALSRLRAEEPVAAAAMPAEPPAVPMPIAAPEPPPLDLTAVETAVAGAAEALDALETVADVDDPARKRLMVDWYRKLATVGEACALLETAASEAGRPLDSSPESVDGMLGRIQSSDLAVADLRTLGRMWLGSQKRRADGTVLVATAESVRPIGPYWSTRATLPGPDGAGRVVAVISRRQPAVDIGDQIIITGVLFDTDTVWAADVRPLGSTEADIGELPAIGIPPLFQEPTEPLPVVEPPMLKDADVGDKRQPAAAEPAEKADADAAGAATKPVATDDEKPAADAAVDAAENATESDAAPES